MRYLLTLTAVSAALAAAAIPAYATIPSGVRLITDTLGGNGHAKSTPDQGYRFITDTLARGGGSTIAVDSPSVGFSWTDAGVGAGAGFGALLCLTGATLVVLRRRGHLAT